MTSRLAGYGLVVVVIIIIIIIIIILIISQTPMSCAEDVEKNRRQSNTLLQDVSN